MQWFRDISIYPDLGGYEEVFERAKYSNNIGVIALFDGGYEFGWYFLNFILSRIVDNFDIFLKFIGTIVCAGYVYAVHKYSNKPLFSILFILLYPSAFGMSFYVLKQSFAFAIILYALHFLNDKKPHKYIAVILFALTFHYSALIFLPLYWIKKSVDNGTSLKVLFVAGTFVLLSSRLPNLLSLVDISGDKYDSYLESGGNLLPLLIVLSITSLMVFKRKSIIANQVYETSPMKNDYSTLIFSYSILGTIVCFCILGTSMDRMALYFTNFLAFSVPMVASFFHPKQGKFLCVVYLLSAFIWVMLSDDYCDIKHFRLI